MSCSATCCCRTACSVFAPRSAAIHQAMLSFKSLMFSIISTQATPAADTAFFYFETNQLGFTPEFMGRIRLAGSIASLIGVSLLSVTLCGNVSEALICVTCLLDKTRGKPA